MCILIEIYQEIFGGMDIVWCALVTAAVADSVLDDKVHEPYWQETLGSDALCARVSAVVSFHYNSYIKLGFLGSKISIS